MDKNQNRKNAETLKERAYKFYDEATHGKQVFPDMREIMVNFVLRELTAISREILKRAQ